MQQDQTNDSMLTDTLLNTHASKVRSMIYIALEDINYSWSKKSILRVLNLWNAGFSLEFISKDVEREFDEVALLIMDLDHYLFLPRSRNIQLSEPLKNLSPRFQGNKKRFFKDLNEEYLVFEQYVDELYWDERDVRKFEKLWNQGYSIKRIAIQVQRTEFEVMLLVMDRCRLRYIAPRPSGREGVCV